MKRLLAAALASGAAMLLSTALTTTQAMAATTVPVSVTFAENIVPALNSGCDIHTGACGQGEVNPFGQATETIVFYACGTDPECDVRTINLAGGMIFIHEFPGPGTCRGVCQPNPAFPGGGPLTDVIVGGTGQFAGATGNLSGSVRLAGLGATIKLSGTITLAT